MTHFPRSQTHLGRPPSFIVDVTCGAQPGGEENRATRDRVGGRKEGARNAELGEKGRKEGRKGGREEIEPRDLANKRGRRKEGTSLSLSFSFSGQSSSLDCVLKRGARASQRAQCRHNKHIYSPRFRAGGKVKDRLSA